MLLDRHSFYRKVRVDGIRELDLLSGKLPQFDFSRYSNFIVTQASEGRPDLISQRVYDTVELWWLILLANDIIDPFDELYVGRRLKIPQINEYYDFYNANAARRRDDEP